MAGNSRILVLVDVQNGFCGSENAEAIGRLQKLCESDNVTAVVATQFINKRDSLYETVLDWHEMFGGSEIELVDEIKEYVNNVVPKDTYGCMNEDFLATIGNIHWRTFSDDEKRAAIAANEGTLPSPLPLPNEVLVAGADTEACVYAAAVGLFDCGIRPIVVEDCCWSSGGQEMHEAGITIMRRTLGKKQIISSDEL